MNSHRRLFVATLVGIGIGWVAFAPTSPFLKNDFPRLADEEKREPVEILADDTENGGYDDQLEMNEEKSLMQELGITPDRRWPRIFCMINTMPSHVDKIKTVNATWARHCDGHIFTTTMTNDTENIHDYWTFNFTNARYNINNHYWLWDRLRAGMKKLYEEKGKSYDWFLKADDDTFVVIENLKEYLKGRSPNEPLYLATMLKYMDHSLTKRPRDFIYPSGGSGYILSREGLKRFVEVIEESNGEKCRNTSYLHEDTEVGWCLRSAGVTAIPSVDRQGAHMMLPIDVMDIIHPTNRISGMDRGWARQSVAAKLQPGKACCSTNLITTHYVSDIMMATYYYLVYGVRVAGRDVDVLG
ncbi:unnamed protein product, partial [Mesorhabditis belari]|uniref:N-acetylgalactosaminide beta-1,3-galactosyltransferase n=1 Tax=Mesorhabditis belari TaxID=2138241 RepID=A0AAF3F405_9BILA